MKLPLLLLTTPALAAVLDTGASTQNVLGDKKVGVGETAFACDLPPAVAPDADGLPSAGELFAGADALALQVRRHAALVQIPTISYDDMRDVGDDDRWDVFYAFEGVLRSTFPTVFARSNVTHVNTHGLVFFIEGTNAALKPLMLAAHQDVVPVPDPSAWTHAPFAGYFDGAWLWGRGASDDKNSLTGILTTLETLLANDAWVPRRSLVVALGFDEESSGKYGAGRIATYLEATFGPDSMVLLLDEGGSGLETVAGADGHATVYALPAVMEKGHIDILYELHVRGGHSSVPLPHTGIGIAAELITALESHPYTGKMAAGSPLHQTQVCKARYTPDEDPAATALVRAGDLAGLAALLSSYSAQLDFQMRTSQAVDIVAGGLKINAMPETIEIGVNYRVAPHESLAGVKARSIEVVQPVLAKYGIALTAFGTTYPPPVSAAYADVYNASLIVRSRQETEVAKVSPTSGPVWDLFSGTIQHTFASDTATVVPVGGIMNGNTDTRHYTKLTPSIYRWTPVRQGLARNMHAIDEAVHMDAHLETVQFYYNLVRNFDQSDV